MTERAFACLHLMITLAEFSLCSGKVVFIITKYEFQCICSKFQEVIASVCTRVSVLVTQTSGMPRFLIRTLVLNKASSQLLLCEIFTS